jgi:hypothetical protein
VPLSISEKEAVRILFRERQRRGESSGLNQFARVVLGAHSEQAKELAGIAAELQDESRIDDYQLSVESENIQVSREIDGRTLNLTLKADRLPITSYEELVDFYSIDTKVWQPTKQDFRFWGSEKSPNFSVGASFQRDEYQALSAEDRDAYREWAKEFAPDLSKVEWQEPDAAGNLLEIFITDLHADKVADGWNPVVAKEHLIKTVQSHVSRATVDGVEKILIVFNGDTFNRDFGDATTAGTPQAYGGRNQSVFAFIREAICEAVLIAAHVAPVEVLILPGNHDFEKSYYLADSVWAFFNSTDRVEVNVEPETRMYVHWGRVVLGFAHGKDESPKDLPLLMLREADCRNAIATEWHIGHLHTKRQLSEDETQGVLIRLFRSPAPEGDWEKRMGYVGNRREITSMLWHRERGKRAEYTEQF